MTRAEEIDHFTRQYEEVLLLHLTNAEAMARGYRIDAGNRAISAAAEAAAILTALQGMKRGQA